MGACVSGQKSAENIFLVKNINEDKRLVQKGHLEVSITELIYTDLNSNDRWNWPLRYLRKYGCDGEVFSFEAGRKCPGGEGLYAFSSKRASKIFELVARNINQGEQQQNGEISPFPSEARPPDHSTMSFIHSHTSNQEVNYSNIGPTGLPLVECGPEVTPETLISEADGQNGLPPKGQYREVIFQKPPEDHPLPEQNPTVTTSYTQIDFERTEQMSRERLQGTLLQNSLLQNPHRNSGSVSLPPSSRSKHRHRRLNTVSSGTGNHRHSSESSFSSQSSLTESSRNLTSPQVNGHATHPIIGEEPTPGVGVTYENVSKPLQQPQQANSSFYQNVNLGQGSVNDVFNVPESRYANMEYPLSGSRRQTSSSSSLTPIRVNGIGTYADVEINPSFRSRATSTPVSKDQPSYLQLEFSRDKDQSTTGKQGDESAQTHTSLVPQPSLTAQPRSPDLSIVKPREEVSLVLQPPISDLHVIDETKVAYGTLNFPAMAALSETSRAREQEISENKHERSDHQEAHRGGRRTSSSHDKSSKKKDK